MWLGETPFPEVPSPKSHSNETMLPSSLDGEPSKFREAPVVPVDGPLMTAVGAAAHATEVRIGLTSKANAISSANAARPSCRATITELRRPVPDNAVAPFPFLP